MSDEGDKPESISDSAAPAPLMEMLDLDAVDDAAEPDVVVDGEDHRVSLTLADDADLDLERLCTVALSVLSEEGAAPGQLDLHLVDAETMRELNLTHMRSDEPTDVLAFPLEPDEFDQAGDRRAVLGDVVICPQVAFAQAPGHTGSFESEMLLLAIHGTLHVLGHDHGETDERLEMQSRERHHLGLLDIQHPVPAP